eukprot:SAG11_NODE_5569_length_1521_cov_1.804501_1_plen_46_part_00
MPTSGREGEVVATRAGAEAMAGGAAAVAAAVAEVEAGAALYQVLV